MTDIRTINTSRVDRLNAASLRRVVEPDIDVPGPFTQSQIIPDALLSIDELDIELTAAQRATLAREEMASIVRAGILFEAVLISGFAYRLALDTDVTDPRFTYALHEIGEETRHSRLFVRLVEELEPTQYNPFDSRLAVSARAFVLPLLMKRPATLDAFVLAGEEIPDLFQKLAAEHPDTDDYVRRVSRYHRLEEARHLAYARTTVGEHYQDAGWSDRFAVRWIVPVAMLGMFDTIVQPYVYPTVGLPAIETWLRVRRQPNRVARRRQCARAVLGALVDARVFGPGSIPWAWRYAAAVDGDGRAQDRNVDGPAAVASAITAAADSLRRATVATARRTVANGIETARRLARALTRS